MNRKPSRPAWLRLPDRFPAITLFGALFLLFVATANYHRQNMDTMAALLPAWKLTAHGNLRVDEFAGPVTWIVPVDGHWLSNRFPGTIALLLPAYALSQLLTSSVTLWPAGLTMAIVVAAAMSLLYLALRTLVGNKMGLVATIVFALASGTWALSADAAWTHGPDQLWLALAMLALTRGRERLAGLAFGAAVFTRPYMAIVAGVSGLWLCWQARSWRPAARIAPGSLLGLGALLVYTHTVFHIWSVSGYSATFSYASDPTGITSEGHVFKPLVTNLAGAAFAPSHGLFVYCPLFLVLLPALRAGWRVAPPWARAVAVGGVASFGAQLYMNYFSGGSFYYGYRLPLEMLTCLLPLLALGYRAAVRASANWRRLAHATCVLTLFIQALGAIPGVEPSNVNTRWWGSDFLRELRLRSPLFLALVAVGTIALGIVLERALARPAGKASDTSSPELLRAELARS